MRRKQRKGKQLVYDEQIRIYEENVRQHAREKEKMEELSWKMNLLQGSSEFWDGKEAYLALIEKHKEQLEETKLVRKSLIQQSNKKSGLKEGASNTKSEMKISGFEEMDAGQDF